MITDKTPVKLSAATFIAVVIGIVSAVGWGFSQKMKLETLELKMSYMNYQIEELKTDVKDIKRELSRLHGAAE